MSRGWLYFCLGLAVALAVPAVSHPDGPPWPPPPEAFSMPDGPPPLAPGPLPPLTPAIDQRFLAWTRANDPDSLSALGDIQVHRPELYHQIVLQGLLAAGFLDHMKVEDPDAWSSAIEELRADSHSRRLAKAWQDAPAGDRAGLQAELQTVLAHLVEVRQVNRRHRLDRLRRHLAEEEAAWRTRQANPQAEVDRRLQDLLRDPGSPW